MSSSYGRL
jgi:hypothetical protein